MEIHNKNHVSTQLPTPTKTSSEPNTDLSKTENPIDKEILQAFNSKKISEASPIELDSTVINAISKAISVIGRKNDSNLSSELNFIYENLPDELRLYCQNMRLNEIPIAISRGIYKEYGEYYGFNVAEIVRFCLAYCTSIQRINTVKAIQAKQIADPEKKIPSRSERWETFNINIFGAFKKFKNTGNYDAVAPSLYDTLVEIGLINLPVADKYDLMELAAQRVISDQNLKLSVLVADYDRRPLKNIIEQIQTSINEQKPVSDEVKALILAKCKKLALDNFFRVVIDLPGIIEERKELYLSL